MISRKCRPHCFLLVITIFLMAIGQSFGQCSAIINSFPYRESFESGTANWVSGGTNSDWTWGSPVKAVINSAGDGTKCWFTGNSPVSFYNYGERSWIQSPCFDLTAVNKPYLSFLVLWDSEWRYDGANIQYSIDGGNNWFTIGSSNETPGCNMQNWYNASAITNLTGFVNLTTGWSGNTQPTVGSCQGGHGLGTWVRASHCVPQVANQPQVLFRFAFGSGTTCNDYDGFAFDDFYVGTPPASPIDFTYSCVGNSTIDFSAGALACVDTYQWDFGDPSSSSNTSTAIGDSHTYSGYGSFNVTLTAGGNCSADTSITKQVRILNANISSTNVTCQNDSDGTASVTVQGASTSTLIEWNTVPVQSTLSISGLPVGNYTATISDPTACGLTLNTSIVEGPGSRPVVDIGSDFTICPGTDKPIVVSDFSTYLWQDGSTDSVYIVSQPGEVSLIVTNTVGCEAYDSLLVTEDCLNDVLFPNAFTPNEDGINELFNGIGSIPEKYSLRIYNRWGEVVFETDQIDRGWDGKYKGHFAHDGIYVYQAIFTISNNEEIEKTGRLLLIR